MERRAGSASSTNPPAKEDGSRCPFPVVPAEPSPPFSPPVSSCRSVPAARQGRQRHSRRLRQGGGRHHLPDLEPPRQLQALLRGPDRRLREEVPRHRREVDRPAGRGLRRQDQRGRRGGTLPDVVNVSPDLVAPLAKAGLALDLDKAASQYKKEYLEGAWASHQIPGMTGTYAFPGTSTPARSSTTSPSSRRPDSTPSSRRRRTTRSSTPP